MMAEEVTAVEAEVEDSSAPADAVETTEVQAEEAPAEQKLELSEKAFSEFGLGEALCTSLKEQGFERPTIVQAEAMEPMLARKDLIVQSKTGSGKTLAFGVPLLERYQGSESESKKPRRLFSHRHASLRIRSRPNSVRLVSHSVFEFSRSMVAFPLVDK